MSLRAVVIGCGNIGLRYDLNRPPEALPYSHSFGLIRHPAFTLAGVADPDETRLAEATLRLGVAGDTDAARLMACVRPDLVCIATPPSLRLPLVQAAIAAGARAIFCEKPLAPSLAEARTIVDSCREAGVMLSVNHSRRWEPGCQHVAQLLSSGELGRVQRCFGRYVRGLWNSGSHMLDLLLWWTGEVTEATVTGHAVPDSPDIRLLGRDGASHALHGLPGTGLDVFELDVFCDHGMVRLSDYGNRIILRRREPLGFGEPPVYVLGPEQALAVDLDAVMMNALEDIARSLAAGTATRCGGAEGLAVIGLLEALS